jgi:hypothetical protein
LLTKLIREKFRVNLTAGIFDPEKFELFLIYSSQKIQSGSPQIKGKLLDKQNLVYICTHLKTSTLFRYIAGWSSSEKLQIFDLQYFSRVLEMVAKLKILTISGLVAGKYACYCILHKELESILRGGAVGSSLGS